MDVKAINNGYNVIYSDSIILYDDKTDLELNIEANKNFSFDIIFQFYEDGTKKTKIEKEVTGNTLVLKCLNFDSRSGTGTTRPISIATIDQKTWKLHFWLYLLGENDTRTRKIEYTIFEKIG